MDYKPIIYMVYYRYSDLDTHSCIVHCDFCDNLFHTRTELKDHISHSHDIYQCTFCEKGFLTKEQTQVGMHSNIK